VQSDPSSAEREAEYNDWYSKTHLGELCAIPGIVAARRYRVHDAGIPGSDSSPQKYLAIYELEADDVGAPIDELQKRAADGKIELSGALQMSPPPVATLYELME
jgi:hypothetical protein